jgi:hypothetical protein
MNLTETLNAQHATYERDLEPDNYGLDTNPWDFDHDITQTIPCHYCGFTDCDTIDITTAFQFSNLRCGS